MGDWSGVLASSKWYKIFTESADCTGPIQSLVCDVHESSVCVSVCAIVESPLLGGLKILVKECIANIGSNVLQPAP